MLFSYLGVVYIALYAGVARTAVIGYQTFVLIIINLILNYGFIFGHFGLPSMGIGGAALASTLAEAITLIIFTFFIFLDNKKYQYHIFNLHPINWKIIRQIIQVSVPFVVQSIVGLGSWFLLFSWIENMGEKELAISNLGRIVYLILSVPIWGYAAGIQTLVSGYIGKDRLNAVIPIIKTAIIAVPALLLPEYLFYPILGADDMQLVYDTKPIFQIILILLLMFSVATIFFNGLSGTGASLQALIIQIACTIFYMVVAFYIIKIKQMGLNWAWGSESIYWVIIFLSSAYALYGPGEYPVIKVMCIKQSVSWIMASIKIPSAKYWPIRFQIKLKIISFCMPILQEPKPFSPIYTGRRQVISMYGRGLPRMLW